MKILAALLLVATAAAAQSLTPIVDRVVNADASPFSGSVLVNWQGAPPLTAGGAPVSGLQSTTRIRAGILSLTLFPNTPGTQYTAVFSSSSGLSRWSEVWQVPVSSVALKLSQIRISSTNGQAGPANTCPPPGAVAAWIDAETPSGVTDGANAVFHLASPPIAPTSLQLYKNGFLQTQGIDYTLSGTVITFTPVAVPISSDVLRAYYRTGSTMTAYQLIDGEVPLGAVDGSNQVFQLATQPLPAASLKVFVNGLLELPGRYSASALTITFAGLAPVVGDKIAVYYRHP